MTSAAAVRRLQELADPRHAVNLLRFFKTGPGQYGAGDAFLGLRVPQLRQLVREFRHLDLAEVVELLQSKWHEARLLALMIMVEQYKRGDERERREIYRHYLRNTARINNWDLVDSSAPHIVGAHLRDRSRAPLVKLARSKSLWERRIAMLATQHLIRNAEFDDALRIAEILVRDEHDLIHKAVGWMLRELGDRDRGALQSFLAKYAATMPRTMLRYAIEHLSVAERRRWMSL
jgi:3-methyladenine DNA glycosylase AlkD